MRIDTAVPERSAERGGLLLLEPLPLLPSRCLSLYPIGYIDGRKSRLRAERRKCQHTCRRLIQGPTSFVRPCSRWAGVAICGLETKRIHAEVRGRITAHAEPAHRPR